MKILWICHFSNSIIREKLRFDNNALELLIRFLLNKKKNIISDFAVWITNAISEFEYNDDIELHIVSPHYGMKCKREDFSLNGIYYHFFRPSDNSLIKRKIINLGNLNRIKYKYNRHIIDSIINEVNPDVIHMYGAENPYYSMAALDVEIKKTPFLISLQTLMSDPEFKKNYPISSTEYDFRSRIEKQILQKVTYIGSTITKYRELIWNDINSDAIFFNTSLAVAEKVKFNFAKKIYDFVYFSVQLEKAADIAIEVFYLVCKKYPSSTLNIIGGSGTDFQKKLINRISKLGIEKNITFSGMLPTHNDVMCQIKKSRFALLPLKIDVISGTIREAMSSGLPVVTTITSGTPTLNRNRKSVLLSKQGDLEAMSENMLCLLESSEFAEEIIKNGFITVNERWNNKKIMERLLKTYQVMINHHNNGVRVPIEIGSYNPKNK